MAIRMSAALRSNYFVLDRMQKRMKQKWPLIFGMVHVPALPGTPRHHSMYEVSERVMEESGIYARQGVDGIIFENMHDLPYTQKVGPEIVAAMTEISARGMREANKANQTPASMIFGVQILAAANREAMAVAHAIGAHFIRAEAFVFGHVADEGLMNACAGELLRYRRQIEATRVAVFADIKKKHSSHAITADISIAETAKAAEFFGVDGVIVTGTATGESANVEEFKAVQSKCPNLPVLIGSGITTANAHNYNHAAAFIVGSHFKVGGEWNGRLDAGRIRKLVNRVREDSLYYDNYDDDDCSDDDDYTDDDDS